MLYLPVPVPRRCICTFSEEAQKHRDVVGEVEHHPHHSHEAGHEHGEGPSAPQAAMQSLVSSVFVISE